MSAQFSDTLTYNGTEYNIIALTDPPLFNPEEHGLAPDMPHTACRRGYCCKFSADKNGLRLDTLYIKTRSGEYPILNGIKAKKASANSLFDDMKAYNRLDLPIAIDEKIVIGCGLLPEYCINMGFQHPIAYEKVLELVFEKGCLISETDHSQYISEMRSEIGSKRNFERKIGADADEFISACFSLDIKIKAPWIS